MSLSQTEHEWLEGMIEAYDGNEKMTGEWRRNFMKDQLDRFAKYGKDMYLSAKQWKVVRDVAEDIGYEGPSGGTSQSGGGDYYNNNIPD